ncbi:DUF2304 domain-containing protein [Candidatus Woesearchaeota archaeon]|jgi:hypothetical protein|nr:DUF2304 domain-containing protein [Candidatus Woesearchaeota archaeon]MBT4368861.1 DUF2304 domain-containing protein [Candidatus Woesearchaeota archaeon]MBT4712150.1 DUF2304 domain-containing protein [Candidatus Woesearchaeota archaeon]MBT6639102.1 DUF2304 domain-containing protein [Candidatus Woesearchaeota archaeon]MBT7134302.1 DUF2304 domain-containing protein [Candidatus Woesearchaeota archaeon]
MLVGIQIIGVLFGAVLLYLSFVNFKKKEFRSGEFVLWTIFWLVFIFLIIFPNILDKITRTLSIVRTLDFLTIIGFLFLILLGFQNYRLVKKNNKKVEEIVRKIALKNCEVIETDNLSKKTEDEERK